jgi:uncharacterized membrane protein HdeD (DUF308 family)
MSLNLILMVLGLHWLFDFVFQTHKQATEKSKSFFMLFNHCAVYCLWGIVIAFLFPTILGCVFFMYLLLTHFIIDGITSRITSYLWKKERVHDFFVVIGADQVLHYVSIFWYLNLINLV